MKYVVLGIPEDKYDSLMRQMVLDRNFSTCEITEIPDGHDKIIDAGFLLDCQIAPSLPQKSDRTRGWDEACQAIYENATPIIGADIG